MTIRSPNRPASRRAKTSSPGKTKRSLLISFEGIDGSGKSTQLLLAQEYLTDRGYRVAALREPGSTQAAESIRSLLLDRTAEISPIAELLLYAAARADLVAHSLIPALAAHDIVLIDRFFDSTTAYQGYGRNLDLAMVARLNAMASGGVVPQLTLIFDLPLPVSLERRGKDPDRLEAQSRSFFRRVQHGYRQIAAADPVRCRLIKSNRPVERVQTEVRMLLDTVLGRKR